MKQFKIRASALSKIMGNIGLTVKQKEYLAALELRDAGTGKPLTENMEADLADLRKKNSSNELPDTCTSYLKEWYADENQSIHSKYIDKGIMMEQEAIDFMAQVLEFGVAEKNTTQAENEFMTGCCDVNLPEAIVDVKCPWDKQNLHANVYCMDADYKWQGIGYCILYKKFKFILFYALMDTDESINYGDEVIYSDMPDEQRWLAYQIEFTELELQVIYQLIQQRVIMCRNWLAKYDSLVRSTLGKVTIIGK